MNSLEVTSVLKDSQHNFFLRIKGMIPALVVVIVAAVPPSIPAVLQLIHTRTAGQLSDFFQNRLIYRLTVAVDAGRVDFECCKQNILFGIHDGQHIFEALRRVLACIHMDVHSAAVVYDAPCTAQGADDLLQLFHLAVFKLGGVQFNLVGLPNKNSPPAAFGMDTAVPNDFPLFTVQIFDPVGIVATAGMLGAGAK